MANATASAMASTASTSGQQPDVELLQAYGLELPQHLQSSKHISEMLLQISSHIPPEINDDSATLYLRMGGANDGNISRFIEMHHQRQRCYFKTMREVMRSIANKFVSTHNNKIFPITSPELVEDSIATSSTANASPGIRTSKTTSELINLDTLSDNDHPLRIRNPELHETISYTSLMSYT